MDDLEFGREFLIWQRRVGVDRRAQAAFMFAMKSLKDPLSFIQGVNQNNVNLPGTFAKLTSEGADMSEITKMIADLKVREVAKKAQADKEKDSGNMAGVQFAPAQDVVKPEGETEDPGDSKVFIPVPSQQKKYTLNRSARPIPGRDEKPEGDEQAKPETDVEISGEEPVGWRAKLAAKAKLLLPTTKTGVKPSTSTRRSISGGGGMGSDITSKIKERWQIFAIGIIALVFILSIAFLGPLSGGQSEVHSTGSPIDTLPVIAFFTMIIMAPLFLESWDRGDIFDAVFVLVSVFMSSTAVVYENKWSTLVTGARPLGTYIIGFFFLAPYLIMIMSAVTNRTRNVFASRIFSKLDFTPVYMTLLIFWAMAKIHVYWAWLPNPCFFPETFYLNAGILFLILELSGNFINLGIALAAGVASGFLMFNTSYFYVVFIIYMLVMGYSSTDLATREMTMNVDSAPGSEGGTSFGKGVRSKRFVPYDLLAGALWFNAITVVILKGNPAFPFHLPF